MSTVRLKERPDLNDQMLRSEHLVFACQITHNATPANKTFSADIPSVVMLRAQGQTAAVDAVELLTWSAPTDNTAGNSVFGLYLNIGKTVTPSLGPVPSAEDYADRVYSVSVVDANGHVLAVTGPNAVANAWLTPLGNIAIEVAATALNLSTTDAPLVVIVNYREQVK